jgi:integrase/recombinase XerD
MDQVSNAQLIADFKVDLVLRDQSASTVKNYPSFVKTFADFIAPDSLLTVNKSHLSRYLAHLRTKKLTHASLQKYFTGLSTFFEFLVYDEQIDHNPVLPFRKHYFRGEPNHTSERRQCISVDQARTMISRILDIKERAVVMLLFMTGMRLHELSDLDITNVDIADRSIRIKKTHKRSHTLVFYDNQTAAVLNRYLSSRKNKNPSDPLFINRFGKRLSTVDISRIVQKHATACGFHDPNSDRSHLEARFSTHCTRHAFTTWLGRAHMEEKYIEELRGDKWRKTIGIYTHIEHDELKAEYDAHMPHLLT